MPPGPETPVGVVDSGLEISDKGQLGGEQGDDENATRKEENAITKEEDDKEEKKKKGKMEKNDKAENIENDKKGVVYENKAKEAKNCVTNRNWGGTKARNEGI